MGPHDMSPKVRKTLLGIAGRTSLVFGIMLIVITPARAEYVSFNVSENAEWVWEQTTKVADDIYKKATDLLKENQTSAAAASNVAGLALVAQSNTNNADAINGTSVRNGLAAANMDIGAKTYIPPNQSSCGVAGGSSDQKTSAADGAGVVQAITQANGNRPDDPITNAQTIKNRCALNFAPAASATNDPEASVYKALNCNSTGAHAHADEVLQALLGPLEYPVDPQLKLVNKKFQSLTTPPADKYYLFDAAFFYCLNVNPPQPVPPQSPDGKANIGQLSIGAYVNADSATSVGPGATFAALERRMQYGPEVDASLQSRYTDQAKRCQDDNTANILDDDKLADCVAHGRSDLQADHDKAFRNASGRYQTNVIAQVNDRDTAQKLTSMGWDAENEFGKFLAAERKTVSLAVDTANSFGHSLSTTSASGLSQSTK